MLDTITKKIEKMSYFLIQIYFGIEYVPTLFHCGDRFFIYLYDALLNLSVFI